MVESTVAADEEDDEPRNYGLELTLAAVLVVILALSIAIVLVWRRQQAKLVNNAEMTVVDAAATRDNDDANQTWTNAERKSLAMNDVVVAITGVQYGPVRGRDGEKYVVVDNNKLLQIRLKITNFQSRAARLSQLVHVAVFARWTNLAGVAGRRSRQRLSAAFDPHARVAASHARG
jgi:hypothetical protein